MTKQIETVKRFITLVESLQLNENNSSDILHPEYVQWELPNQLNSSGTKSDKTESLRRMQTAKTIMASQSYEVTSTLEQGNTVVVEALWRGKMALDAGPFKKDQVLKAFFCMFFEFKDEKIFRVKNYDCFEPF